MEFIEVVTGGEFFFFEKIMDPTGLFHHDGHGVVDLMGDARSQFSHRRQLAGFNDLLVHHRFFLVGHLDAGHHFPGENPGHGNDGEAADEEDQAGQLSGPA